MITLHNLEGLKPSWACHPIVSTGPRGWIADHGRFEMITASQQPIRPEIRAHPVSAAARGNRKRKKLFVKEIRACRVCGACSLDDWTWHQLNARSASQNQTILLALLHGGDRQCHSVPNMLQVQERLTENQSARSLPSQVTFLIWPANFETDEWAWGMHSNRRRKL